MSLRDVEVKNEYRSLVDDVAKEFYIPLLSQSISYDRAVGFFSSSALVEISKGISALVKNGGKIRIVASPYLSDEDIFAIKRGYDMREQIIYNSLLRCLKENDDAYESDRLNLLATLIADGTLDIKIALTESSNRMGMYHEKMGIIRDGEGNKVAFSGSMNESSTAIKANYETIDVFCSWTEDKERVQLKETAFSAIWNNCEPNIEIIEFPNLKDEIIKKYKRSIPNFNIDEEEFGKEVYELSKSKNCYPKIPSTVKLYDYQISAIENWKKHNYRGIFDMATGTGKTLTGLGAMTKLSGECANQLAVIILCPYQHLVEQWVEDIEQFNISPIIGYSSSFQKDWKQRLSKAIFDKKIRTDEKGFFCFICTNATFSSEFVQSQISKINGKILLIADEAHNLGAPKLRTLFDNRFNYRLALSATLDRHHDEEGTDFLYTYFGEKCIEYTLEQAIDEGKLTPYNYYPVLVYLTEDELIEYSDLSLQMSKCIIKGKGGKTKLNKHGEFLAIKRSRLIAAASGKIEALKQEIQPYIKENDILVYCGAANIDTSVTDEIETDESEIRQIDIITHMLGNTLNMKVSQFTSRENMEKRAQIITQFKSGNDLQVLVAIKCLDEGVNIPGIITAFILASTTNPKEYIQRRGRVLRRAPGKEKAEIYDFVTLPRPIDEVSSLSIFEVKRDISLIRNELVRIKEFGRLALNSMIANEIYQNICEAYSLDSITLKMIGEKMEDE